MRRSRPLLLLTVVALLASLGAAPAAAAPAATTTVTILHTNDFHGQLEPSGSNPGAARVANKVNEVRTAVGADNVLLLDGGDMMQGSLLSNIQKGLPTVDYYATLGYDGATLGNHEFDWGQDVLGDRIAQAETGGMQMLAANITKKDAGGACTWEPFNAAVTPYEVFTVGNAPNEVKVGVIGVGSVETPYITIAEATAGLCFRDPAESILRYYDALDAASDVIVVLSHNGYTDGGYGYGFTVYGDQTLAKKLNDAGKPANLIIGGHSHTDLAAATMVGSTAVVQAHYNGRKVGRADVTVTPTGAVSVSWTRLTVGTSDPKDPTIDALVGGYASDPGYLALINEPVGYSQVDLLRNYNGDSMMGDFVDDAIYGALNADATTTNDVDMFFNNPGGIRIDWCDKEDPPGSGTYVWTSAAADCQAAGLWSHDPMLLTYGQMFQILPFGNATAVGTMTGAQVHDLLQQSATLFKGALQPSGIRYKLFRYSDALPGPQPYAWGAYDIEVFNKTSAAWESLDPAKTYKVGTNEFLAPAGQDGFTPFKYLKNVTYWGDMLNAVNAYVGATYGTPATAYKGPNGDGTLDGRIARNGDGDDVYEPGEVVPVTILHHNDSHGRLLASGSNAGYANLVTLIKQARAHNPERTLLLTAGDNVQGDSMMYFFKSAGLGYSADGLTLPPDLSINPLIKAFNAVGYDAMVLGNHEFNFGSAVFKTLAQATFPMLQANIADDGTYGLDVVGVEPYVEKTVGPEGIEIAILGIGNHRVPSYELPSNIPGLTFTNPIEAGKDYAPTLAAANDAVIALTHIGFTTNPASVEVDDNVDTFFAAEVPGVDAVIGGHSHTSPVSGFGDYKFLPTFVAGPDGTPVLVTQAYRYNTYLGEVVLGLLPKAGGGYEVVSTAGRYSAVPTTSPDATIVDIVAPYQDLINVYNNTAIGSTTVPIDTNSAFTEETNGANLQADASVWKLESEGIPVDVHLSGAMTNRRIADAATPTTPYELKVSDMFAAMPYENSLVVMRMNGPQLKAVLERAYRNYYYYKYVAGYGGYSYYTTCMLDTDKVGKVTYNDLNPALPNGNNVVSLKIGSSFVNFNDATKYYRVSTVNYLAAGACNFSDGGKTLWPLDQIVADTQYYVRDAVIEYVDAQTAPIAPAIEGRLAFISDSTGPAITITSPAAKTYLHSSIITVAFSATDTPAGVASVTAKLDGAAIKNGARIDLLKLKLGSHTLAVTAVDKAGNVATSSVTFKVTATTSSLINTVKRYYDQGAIKSRYLRDRLLTWLRAARTFEEAGKTRWAIVSLASFQVTVGVNTPSRITTAASKVLINDAIVVMARMRDVRL